MNSQNDIITKIGDNKFILILVGGAIAIAGLLFLGDHLYRKYYKEPRQQAIAANLNIELQPRTNNT